MASKIWQGQAAAVAQADKIAVSAYDVATQYRLTVNGEIITSTSGAGSAANTVAALVSGWNAATGNAYARAITAAVSGTDVRLTADIAGNPFTVAGAVSGGTGTMGSATGVISNASPNDWNNVKNWSPTGVPVSTDDVIFRDNASDVLWGLDQASVDLDELVIEQTYTGRIGLNVRAFVTGAAGAETDDRPEYRETSGGYLDIGWTTCRIGENQGSEIPVGSGRLKLDNDKAGASTTEVFNTAGVSVDTDMPAVRLLLNHASANLLVRTAPGGVGVAVDVPGETATMGDVEISDDSLASRVSLGIGVTLGEWKQQGGQNVLRAAAGVTGVLVLGGDLDTEGAGYRITDMEVRGGTCRPNHTPTGGDAITTVNIAGGLVDGTRSRAARTWGTVNLLRAGANLTRDNDVVTITTLNGPTDSGPHTLSVG